MTEEDEFSDNFVCEDDRKARFSEPEDVVAGFGPGLETGQQALRRRRRISSPEFSQVPQKKKATSGGPSKAARGQKRHRRNGETVSLGGGATRSALPSAMDYYTLTSIANSWGMVPVVMKRTGDRREGVGDEYIASSGILRGEEMRPLLLLRSDTAQKRAMSFTYGDSEQDNDEIELMSFKTMAAN